MENGCNTMPSNICENTLIHKEYETTISQIKDMGYEYFWVVEFTDGTRIEQFSPFGKERLFKDVLIKKETVPIKKAWWIPIFNVEAFEVQPLQNQKLILVRTRVMPYAKMPGIKDYKESILQWLYLIGYEELKYQDKIVKSILTINQEGKHEFGNKFADKLIIKK